MDLILKTRAIHKLRPNTEWTLDENNGLIFITPNVTNPTQSEITKAMTEIKSADEQAEADKVAAKQSAQAKLAALGLTANEVAAIVGN
jgi:hypothetical protein